MAEPLPIPAPSHPVLQDPPHKAVLQEPQKRIDEQNEQRKLEQQQLKGFEEFYETLQDSPYQFRLYAIEPSEREVKNSVPLTEVNVKQFSVR